MPPPQQLAPVFLTIPPASRLYHLLHRRHSWQKKIILITQDQYQTASTDIRDSVSMGVVRHPTTIIGDSDHRYRLKLYFLRSLLVHIVATEIIK